LEVQRSKARQTFYDFDSLSVFQIAAADIQRFKAGKITGKVDQTKTCEIFASADAERLKLGTKMSDAEQNFIRVSCVEAAKVKKFKMGAALKNGL